MPDRDTPLPLAGKDSKLSFVERTDLADGRFELVYKAPLGGEARPSKKTTSAFATPPDPDAPESEAPPLPPGAKATITKRRRILAPRLKKLMPLFLQEFAEIEQYEEREMLYGDERSTLLLPKIRLERKKRAITNRGHGLAAFSELRRIVPRLLTFETLYMQGVRRFAFEGARPEAIHVLTRVLETDYRFRIEDLSHYTTHGDLLLRTLDRLDVQTQAFDLDCVVYCPSIDSHFPFKFLVCGESKVDNFVTYMTGLKKLFDKVEKVDAFRERLFGELKLGFEKFGPGCATPEFQEVELKLYKLLYDAGVKMCASVADIVFMPNVNGEAIRKTLKSLHDLHAAIDDCTHLPSTLAAYYRLHFDLPFGQIFEHALKAIDGIAKRIGVDLRDARPKDVETLTELVTTIRKIPARAPLENLEHVDESIAAAYRGEPARARATSPDWVRRYQETIFAGTTKFDARRFKKELDDKELGQAVLDSDVASMESDDPLAGLPD